MPLSALAHADGRGRSATVPPATRCVEPGIHHIRTTYPIATHGLQMG